MARFYVSSRTLECACSRMIVYFRAGSIWRMYLAEAQECGGTIEDALEIIRLVDDPISIRTYAISCNDWSRVII